MARNSSQRGLQVPRSFIREAGSESCIDGDKNGRVLAKLKYSKGSGRAWAVDVQQTIIL